MLIVGLMAAVSLLDTPLSLTNPFVFIQLQRGGDICAYLKGDKTLLYCDALYGTVCPIC